MTDQHAHEYPPFEEPGEPNARIWRYLDLAKFLSMLENGTLYFSRLDLLGDPYEGSRPRGERIRWAARVEQGAVSPEIAQHNAAVVNDMRRLSRDKVSVNCWHLNEHESAAMWHMYSRDAASIAIQSTCERLRRVLPRNIPIGKIRYIDYRTESVPFGNILSYFMHKRKSFEHERELRALIWIMSMADGKPEWGEAQGQSGIEIPVTLTELVEQVVISPDAPEWFLDLVVRIVERYGIQLTVLQSSLLEQPEL